MADESLNAQIVNLYELFATPLVATVKADLGAAITAADYIRKYGFDGPPLASPDHTVHGVDFGELRMVRFWYDATRPDGSQERVVIQIPFLALIPLPLLQVTDAQFVFDIRIISFEERIPQPRLDRALGQRSTAHDPPDINTEMIVKATLAALQPQNGRSQIRSATTMVANIHAQINMRQADIPAGIQTLLNVMQQAAQSHNRPILVLAIHPDSQILRTGVPDPAVEYRIVLSGHGVLGGLRIAVDLEPPRGGLKLTLHLRDDGITNDDGVVFARIAFDPASWEDWPDQTLSLTAWLCDAPPHSQPAPAVGSLTVRRGTPELHVSLQSVTLSEANRVAAVTVTAVGAGHQPDIHGASEGPGVAAVTPVPGTEPGEFTIRRVAPGSTEIVFVLASRPSSSSRVAVTCT